MEEKNKWKMKFLYMKPMTKSMYHVELGRNIVKHNQETWAKLL